MEQLFKQFLLLQKAVERTDGKLRAAGFFSDGALILKTLPSLTRMRTAK
jgi:hypothetical protein